MNTPDLFDEQYSHIRVTLATGEHEWGPSSLLGFVHLVANNNCLNTARVG